MLTRLPSLSSLPSQRITRYQTWTFAEQTKLTRMVNQSPAFQWAWRTAGPGSNRLASPNLLFISLCPRGTDHGQRRSGSSRAVARAFSGSACSDSDFALRATPATNRQARRGMPKPQDPMKKCGCCAARGRAIVFALYRTWRRRLNVSINKGMSLDPHRRMSANGTYGR